MSFISTTFKVLNKKLKKELHEERKNYKADVELALKNGKMTIETKKRFFSAVAAAMFTYKRYPKPEYYQNVARCIINKYPFFKSPVGSPHVSLLICH